jgi:hypothetical protein
LIILPEEPPRLLTYLIDFTSIWQAAYLATMFAFRKKGVGTEQKEGESEALDFDPRGVLET